ncbi:hypothetical protein ACRAWD_29275 [Caulobacter segnis]
MAGHYAIIDHPWTFPLTVTTSLRGAAQPTSIIYTDSLPWLTVAMKALGLGRVLNPLALFLLISYVAQPLAMVALLRACGVKRASSLTLGALIALFLPGLVRAPVRPHRPGRSLAADPGSGLERPGRAGRPFRPTDGRDHPAGRARPGDARPITWSRSQPAWARACCRSCCRSGARRLRMSF